MSHMVYDHNDREFVTWFLEHGNLGDLRKALQSIEHNIDFARLSDEIATVLGGAQRYGPSGNLMAGDSGGNAPPYSGQAPNERNIHIRLTGDKARKLELLDEEAIRRGMS